MIKKLVLEGRCGLTEYEGGFTPPAIWVDGESLDRYLLRWRFGELPLHDRGFCVDEENGEIGKVRITIELLEVTQQ